ncbi:hypothetical protein KOW79_010789 [Hemibagrus wyckioides]|uniref:Uncharacterized protein n=1 Tax=Hemibagrus wyckioides TaxID=337641 RepID=A0A9D3SNJ6_9TELE|nr:hypothetical protein KOW79_010789 [Hemibagrus wyckioides]
MIRYNTYTSDAGVTRLTQLNATLTLSWSQWLLKYMEFHTFLQMTGWLISQAYVVFESVKVPGVLEHTHFLDVHNKFYPVRVKKAHLPKVDMQAEATLDLSMFPKREPVLDLIKSYDFTVTEHNPGHLQLKGSFLKLKLIRNQLIQLQAYEHHYSRSPSALHNGSSLGYDLERSNLDHRFVSKSISRNMDKMDSTPSSSLYRVSKSGGSPRSHQSSLSYYPEGHASSPVDAVDDQKYEKQDRNVLSAHRRSLHADGASSISVNDPSSVNLLQDVSPLNRDLASGRASQSIYSSSYGSTSHTADTTQHRTSYKDLASGRAPQSIYSSSYGSTSHTADTTQHRTSYKDLASGGTPRSNYYSSNGSTGHTEDTMQLHTSYKDLPSDRAPRSIYHSSNGSTSNTTDTPQHHTSYKDSASGGSLRRRPSYSGDTWPSSSHGSPSSSTGEMASFPVDTDIINYILIKRQSDVKAIARDYGTEMTLKDDDGLTTVKFRGKNSEKAKEDLLSIIEKISPSLRTQEIHLITYDHAEQKILERIQHNQDSSVMIKHSGDVIKLVGSSTESFEMKQKLLGHPRGRTKERGSKYRRSISLPKQYKPTHHARIPDTENTASAATKYNPSHYQERPDEGKALQIVRGHELTPDKNSQRTRSNSESRDKNGTTRKSQAVHQDLEVTSSSQGTKTPKNLALQVAKRFDSNIKNIDFIWSIRKKKIIVHNKKT